METEFPRYIDEFLPDTDFHHGKVPYKRGVINRQVVRANRRISKHINSDGTTSTYKHAPDMAYFNGKYLLQYLCTPVDEHGGAGFSILCESTDGLKYGKFRKSFPEYLIPACKVKDSDGKVHVFNGSQYAVMHQRCSFYRSSSDRMLVLGFYGYSPEKWMTPWDRYGIGRVVRELRKDGTLSDIFFIKVCENSGWKKENLKYPLYTESVDKGFVAACEELLSNPLKMQEWAEENGDDDENIPVKHIPGEKLQAFCSYHIDEQTVVGLWKHSWTAISHDNGKTFDTPVKSCSLIMSGQKVWGQRLSDGKFAMVYVPNLESVRRWPLCMTTSEDGLNFHNMELIHGEVPPMRYRGFWKDEGPQYVRGISEDSYRFMEDAPNPDYMFVAYSVNKEDIWVSRIPVTEEKEEKVNIYNPSFTTVVGEEGIYMFCDSDPVDYAKIVKVFEEEKVLTRKLNLSLGSVSNKNLYLELNNKKHETAVRLTFTKEGRILLRTTADVEIGKIDFERCTLTEIEISADCNTCTAEIVIELKDDDGEEIDTIYKQFRFMRAVREISEIELRTGAYRSTADMLHNPEKNVDMNLNTVEYFNQSITEGQIEFI